MHEMENRLRSALRRKAAPPGFAARVLSRVQSQAGPRAAASSRLSKTRVWAIAATLVITAGIGLIEHERRVDRRNRAALEQTLAALSMAATQLGRAQEKALSAAPWERVADRLSRLSVAGAAPSPTATHSNAGGSRI
jgi:hypothetical protein